MAAADSDGDGLPDDFEIDNGLDPSNGADAQRDPDGDGLSIGDEFRRGLDPFDADTDGDGLDDGREVLVVGTDGLRFDTDGDGLSDGLELELGTDPLDARELRLRRRAGLARSAARRVRHRLRHRPRRRFGAASRWSARCATAARSISPRRPAAPPTCRAISRCARSASSRDGSSPASPATAPSRSRTAAGRRRRAASCRPSRRACSPACRSRAARTRSTSPAITPSSPPAARGFRSSTSANRRAPAIVGSIATAGTANDVAVAGSTALVAAGAAGLEVIDVATPASPRRLATLALGGVARGVAAADALAVVVADAIAERRARSSWWIPRIAPHRRCSARRRRRACRAAVAIDTAGADRRRRRRARSASKCSISPIRRGRSRAAARRPGDARAVSARRRLCAGGRRRVEPHRRRRSRPRRSRASWRPCRASSAAFRSTSHASTTSPSPPTSASSRKRRCRSSTSPIPPCRWRERACGYPRPIPAAASTPTRPTSICSPALGATAPAPDSSHLDIGQYRSLRDQLGVAPQVALTSPRDGDVVAAGSRLEITADASDDVGVLAVEFLVDGAVAGRDERPAFGATITVPDDASRLTLGARAYDFAANNAFAAGDRGDGRARGHHDTDRRRGRPARRAGGRSHGWS